MSIKFLIPGYDGTQQTRASYRFRATIPLQGMRPGDKIINNVEHATKDDIVVSEKISTTKKVKKSFEVTNSICPQYGDYFNFCPSCAYNNIKNDFKFCPNCGTSLELR